MYVSVMRVCRLCGRLGGKGDVELGRPNSELHTAAGITKVV